MVLRCTPAARPFLLYIVNKAGGFGLCLVNYFVQNSGGLKNVLIFLAADNIHRAPRGKFKTRNLVYGGVVFYMKYIFFLESGR